MKFNFLPLRRIEVLAGGGVSGVGGGDKLYVRERNLFLEGWNSGQLQSHQF